jgi:hypothetical protein
VKERRMVTLCEGVSKARRSGGPVRLWAYGYDSLAALLGTSTGALRQVISRGQLDPANLDSVCRYWLKRVEQPQAEGEKVDGKDD